MRVSVFVFAALLTLSSPVSANYEPGTLDCDLLKHHAERQAKRTIFWLDRTDVAIINKETAAIIARKEKAAKSRVAAAELATIYAVLCKD